MPERNATPEREIHEAFGRCDSAEVRRLLEKYPSFRQRINDPVFAFNSPAIVACARAVDTESRSNTVALSTIRTILVTVSSVSRRTGE